MSASIPEKELSGSVTEESPLIITPRIGNMDLSLEKAYSEEFKSTLTTEVCFNLFGDLPIEKFVKESKMKILQKVELCLVCKFHKNYCPLTLSCPMEADTLT